MYSVLHVLLLAVHTLASPSENGASHDIRSASDKMLLHRVRRISSRDSVILHPIKARIFPYFEDISYRNSPCFDPDKNRISIDTGSSDMWINAHRWCDCGDAIFEEDGYQTCEKMRNYFEKNEEVAERVSYDDGLTVWGNYIMGSLYFGSGKAILEKVNFMAATDFVNENRAGTANIVSGMIGLGYIRNQQRRQGKQYRTLPHLLYRNGYTDSTAFSMWFEKTLDEKEEQDFIGYILFGGYAENIYRERPEVFSIVGEQNPNEPTEIKIQLDQIHVRGETFISGRHRDEFQVLLDTGSWSSWLPVDVFKAVARAVPVGRSRLRWDFNKERAFAVYEDCIDWEKDETVDFQFGNTIVSVPLDEIVKRPSPDEVIKKELKDNDCVTHGIAAYTDHYLYARNIAKGGNTAHLKKPDLEKDYILGITFLRYAYVFYDLANNQVEMAAIDHDAVAGKKAKLFIFKDGYD